MAKLSGKNGSVVIGTSTTPAGINKWTVEANADALRSSGFDSSGHHESGIGMDGWKGVFAGFKDGAPVAIGSSITLTLKEAQDGSARVFQGSAIIMSRKHDVAYEGAVQYAYDFLGTGALNQDSDFYYASDALLLSSDGEVGSYSLTYEQLKELTAAAGGALRISFDLKCWYAGGTGYGRIYRNGTAIGTERTVTNGNWQTFSEDISGWATGDLIQLWGHTNDALKPASVRNFRIYGTKY